MKQRMRYVFVLALAAGSVALSACGDDDDDSTSNGGSAGASGSKTGGSSTGGSKAGNSSGGKAGSATAGSTSNGGMGGATEAGAGGDSAGAGGSVVGGAAGAGGADTVGGAAGAGGAGGAGELVYACGSATLIQKKCSALVAANCDPATDCSDCVTQATSDREDFQTDPPCDTCNAKWDAFNQCQVDAFESGNLDYGVTCVDGYGADGSDNCYPFLDDAIACEGYVGSDVDPHECPTTWPPQ